jgi:hypothetical protein
MHARTFAIDEGARLLVAGNQGTVTVRQGTTDTVVPANMAVFRLGADGKIEFVRKYDTPATGRGGAVNWLGFVRLQ